MASSISDGQFRCRFLLGRPVVTPPSGNFGTSAQFAERKLPPGPTRCLYAEYTGVHAEDNPPRYGVNPCPLHIKSPIHDYWRLLNNLDKCTRLYSIAQDVMQWDEAPVIFDWILRSKKQTFKEASNEGYFCNSKLPYGRDMGNLNYAVLYLMLFRVEQRTAKIASLRFGV